MSFPPQGIPSYQSPLSMPVQTNNFVPIQSGKILVSNTGSSGSQSLTFTNIPGTQRITMKITNSGTKGAYLATGAGSATAIASQVGVALPTSS